MTYLSKRVHSLILYLISKEIDYTINLKALEKNPFVIKLNKVCTYKFGTEHLKKSVEI